MELEFVENTFSINIEGLEYFLYESYIKNGSGYTFSVYKSHKMSYLRDNVFIINLIYDDRIIVIIGKRYNYILRRKDGDMFDFELQQYEKWQLCLKKDKFNSIYLNENELVKYFSNDDFWDKEIELCNKIKRIRKIDSL